MLDMVDKQQKDVETEIAQLHDEQSLEIKVVARHVGVKADTIRQGLIAGTINVPWEPVDTRIFIQQRYIPSIREQLRAIQEAAQTAAPAPQKKPGVVYLTAQQAAELCAVSDAAIALAAAEGRIAGVKLQEGSGTRGRWWLERESVYAYRDRDRKPANAATTTTVPSASSPPQKKPVEPFYERPMDVQLSPEEEHYAKMEATVNQLDAFHYLDGLVTTEQFRLLVHLNQLPGSGADKVGNWRIDKFYLRQYKQTLLKKRKREEEALLAQQQQKQERGAKEVIETPVQQEEQQETWTDQQAADYLGRTTAAVYSARRLPEDRAYRILGTKDANDIESVKRYKAATQPETIAQLAPDTIASPTPEEQEPVMIERTEAIETVEQAPALTETERIIQPQASTEFTKHEQDHLLEQPPVLSPAYRTEPVRNTPTPPAKHAYTLMRHALEATYDSLSEDEQVQLMFTGLQRVKAPIVLEATFLDERTGKEVVKIVIYTDHRYAVMDSDEEKER